jgi:hypothetical protein
MAQIHRRNVADPVTTLAQEDDAGTVREAIGV